MRRREFIMFIGAALTAYPLAVDAQQNEHARHIAVLIGVEDDAEGQARLAAFRKGMNDLTQRRTISGLHHISRQARKNTAG
jgi:hypothetical protein